MARSPGADRSASVQAFHPGRFYFRGCMQNSARAIPKRNALARPVARVLALREFL
jgi:hypothetical protein